MKTVFICIICIMCQLGALAQSAEQQKKIDEAKRKADSIMNLPHVKKMMKDAKAREAEFLKLEKQRKVSEKSEPKKKAEAKATNKKGEDDFYWRNTIASNTGGKFGDWSYGNTIIKAAFFHRKKRQYVYLPMGSISADGQVTMQFPEMDLQEYPFIPITKNYSEGEGIFNDKLSYSNPDVKWASTRFGLGVYNGDTLLGYIKLGNTIKPVVNLNAPCCLGKAGDGYVASWVYITEPNNVSAKIPSGKNGIITYDLQFKTGWNLIKIEVKGSENDEVYNQQLWTDKHHSVLTSLPTDAKYFFMKQ